MIPMKTLRLIPLCLFLIGPLAAASGFPGLQSIMTEAEWKRAGLDRLTPDQIGVIDAALIRHHLMTTRTAAEAANVTPPATATPAARTKNGVVDRFGLTKLMGDDWRSQPPLVARFAMWQGANRFLLDNGQVWEGLEQIIFELPPGREVIIEARPLNGFAMKLDERSAVVRVQRVK
jgi:hypothetical protein